LKICLIGIFSGDLSEGYRNIAENVAQRISSDNDLLLINVNKLNLNTFFKIKSCNPDIIHYFTAPTFMSIFLLLLIKRLIHNSKIFISALHPISLPNFRNPFFIFFLKLLKPEYILTQSYTIDKYLEKMNINYEFLSNGVDMKKFMPVDSNSKKLLRIKYGFDEDTFILLHVGHIIKSRNLEVLINYKKKNPSTVVVIVNSSHFILDKKIFSNLRDNGCIVLNQYLPNINEVYALSDCYVFPVLPGTSIFTPLSILEAMACNLPVISTEFEGLRRAFIIDNGLIIASGEEEIISNIDKIKTSLIDIKNRDKLENNSWEVITQHLLELYKHANNMGV
jgi:glycosyltransferase involved in cell wall biosynthesis